MKNKHAKNTVAVSTVLVSIIVALLLGSICVLIWYYWGGSISSETSKITHSIADEFSKIGKSNKTEDAVPISIDDALQIAYDQFTKLGEQNLDKSQFQVLKTRRANIDYYYIASKNNTIEIVINGGKINRINNAAVSQ